MFALSYLYRTLRGSLFASFCFASLLTSFCFVSLVASFCFVLLRFASFCFVSLFASFCFLFLLRFTSFCFVLLRFASFCFVLLLLNVLWDLFLLRFTSFCFVLRLPLLFHHLCNVSCHFMTSGPCVAHVLDMTSVFFVRPPVCICRLVAPWGLCAKQSPTWSVHTGLALGQAMWHEASMKPTSPEVWIALELVGLRTPPIWARCAQGPRCPPRPWLRSLWA
jgi:hypothetical protein